MRFMAAISPERILNRELECRLQCKDAPKVAIVLSFLLQYKGIKGPCAPKNIRILLSKLPLNGNFFYTIFPTKGINDIPPRRNFGCIIKILHNANHIPLINYYHVYCLLIVKTMLILLFETPFRAICLFVLFSIIQLNNK